FPRGSVRFFSLPPLRGRAGVGGEGSSPPPHPPPPGGGGPEHRSSEQPRPPPPVGTELLAGGGGEGVLLISAVPCIPARRCNRPCPGMPVQPEPPPDDPMQIAPLAFFFSGPFSVLATAAGAVSVPVIIHLLNRKRFRVVTWAAMRFLLAAQ